MRPRWIETRFHWCKLVQGRCWCVIWEMQKWALHIPDAVGLASVFQSKANRIHSPTQSNPLHHRSLQPWPTKNHPVQEDAIAQEGDGPGATFHASLSLSVFPTLDWFTTTHFARSHTHHPSLSNIWRWNKHQYYGG